MGYYKELLRETKQKQLGGGELIQKVRGLEKQTDKLRVEGTLYPLFDNSELDGAEQRIEELEQGVERQQHPSEKEKAEIRKEVILLQDTIRDKDKTISRQHREIKVYEKERSFVERFSHSFYLLLNIRLVLRKMGFGDDTVARMHKDQEIVRSAVAVYSRMYKRNFMEENVELRIITNEKRQPILTISRLSVSDWYERRWKQLVNRNHSQRPWG